MAAVEVDNDMRAYLRLGLNKGSTAIEVTRWLWLLIHLEEKARLFWDVTCFVARVKVGEIVAEILGNAVQL